MLIRTRTLLYPSAWSLHFLHRFYAIVWSCLSSNGASWVNASGKYITLRNATVHKSCIKGPRSWQSRDKKEYPASYWFLFWRHDAYSVLPVTKLRFAFGICLCSKMFRHLTVTIQASRTAMNLSFRQCNIALFIYSFSVQTWWNCEYRSLHREEVLK